MSDRQSEVLAHIDETLDGAGYGDTSPDAMRWTPPGSAAAEFDEMSIRLRDTLEGVAARMGTTVEAIQELGAALARAGMGQLSNPPVFPMIHPIEGQGISFHMVDEAEVFWVPSVANPAAPTDAEMDAAIPLARIGDSGVSYEAPPLPPEPCRVYWASHGCHLERGHSGPHRCDPGCPPVDRYEPYGEDAGPDAFRRRALEARRNRNTGPQRPDHRRWRQQ